MKMGIDISGVDSISMPKIEETPKTNRQSTHMSTDTGRLTANFGSVISG